MTKRVPRVYAFSTHRANKPHVCPWCATKLDASTNTNEGSMQAPTPGDWTICIRCGEACRYDTDYQLLRVTRLDMMMASPAFWDLYMLPSFTEKRASRKPAKRGD